MINTEVRPNRDIEQFLLSGNFEINEAWGFDQLAEYINDLNALRAGASYADLGIAARRHSALPRVVTLSAAGTPSVITDPEALRDPAYTPPGSYAHLRLQGVMRSQDGMSSRGVNTLIDDIHAANQNPNIEGILLEVNTGGGESTAGAMLQSVIADSPKAVVTWAHFMGSAGVRATLPSDEIVASSEGAEIGSIGTFVTLLRGFSNFYNANYQDIYADKSPNKNREFRQLLGGDMSGLKEYVNRTNEYFLNEVAAYRPLKGDVAHTLSGAMFFAREAKRRGLIDSIGSYNYALGRLEANARRRKKMM